MKNKAKTPYQICAEQFFSGKSWSKKYGPNIFTEDRTVYSYGVHFPMFKLVNINGKNVLLVNHEFASMTTRKHQSKMGYEVARILRKRGVKYEAIQVPHRLLMQENKTYNASKILKGYKHWLYDILSDIEKNRRSKYFDPKYGESYLETVEKMGMLAKDYHKIDQAVLNRFTENIFKAKDNSIETKATQLVKHLLNPLKLTMFLADFSRTGGMIVSPYTDKELS